MMRELDAGTMAGVNRPFPLFWVCTSDGKWNDIAPMATLTGLTHMPVRLILTMNPKRKSFKNVMKTRELVVNIPYGDAATLDTLWDSAWGGFMMGEDKFSILGIETAASKAVRPPRLKRCLASIEYRVLEFLQPSPESGADRPVMVLEPLACAVDEGHYDFGSRKYSGDAPIPLHFGSNMFSVLGKGIIAGAGLRAANRVLGGEEYFSYISSADERNASRNLLEKVREYRKR